MALTSRFAIDTTVLVVGAFLAVVSFAFSAPVAGWIGFGVFVGMICLAALGLATDRHLDGRVVHALLAVCAIWFLIASLVFAGPALSWLMFAGACAVVLLAVTDLVAHEVTTERVVHQLEVTPTSEERSAV